MKAPHKLNPGRFIPLLEAGFYQIVGRNFRIFQPAVTSEGAIVAEGTVSHYNVISTRVKGFGD